MMRDVKLILLCWVLSVPALAQSKLLSQLKQQYPDETGVYTERDKVVTLTIDHDSLRCSATVKETMLCLREQANYSTWRVYGSYFQRIENLETKAFITENGKLKSIKIPDAVKRRDDDGSIFYDDSYFYQITFPVRKEGNVETWSYREHYRDPKFLPAFHFYTGYPMHESSITIKASKGVDLAWKIVNDDGHAIAFRQYEKGGYVFYEFSVKDLKSPVHEPESPNILYYIPHVVYYVKSYTTESGAKKNVLASADDLYKEYQQTLAHLNDQSYPKLDSLVRVLVKDTRSEKEKVEKIFYWVQDHIRYIAFEDGMRGLVPHKPDYIFEKRYGDCKDMASLLVELLRLAGINNAYHTWIGTRSLPYQYSVIPTPVVDNHMIATYVDADKNYYFLDATGNYTRLGLPSSMIQGKESFIVTPTGYEIHVIPEIPADVNSIRDSVNIRINQKSIEGSGTSLLSGYEKINTSYRIDRPNAEDKRDYVVTTLKKGNNKFFLDDFSIHNLENRNAPLRIDYRFRIGDYVSQVGDELYVNLNLDKEVVGQAINSDRKLPIELDFQTLHSETVALEIPKGYELTYLPQAKSRQSKTIDFSISYSASKTHVILKTEIKKHTLMITPSLFADWNGTIEELRKAYKEVLIFKKK